MFKNPFVDKKVRVNINRLKYQNYEVQPAWKKLNSDQKALYKRYVRSANDRGHEFKISVEHFRRLIGSRCFYCGNKPYQKQGDTLYMGIDRVDNSKGYDVNNVTSCCKICNRAKRELTFEEYQNWLYSIKQEFDERETIWNTRRTVLNFFMTRGVQVKDEFITLFGLNGDDYDKVEKESIPENIMECLQYLASPEYTYEDDPKRYEKETQQALQRMIEQSKGLV